MKITIYILILFMNTAIAQTIGPEHEKKLSQLNEITMEDLEHVNKGCPENSRCSAELGKKFQNWKSFLEKLSPLSYRDKVAPLNNYLQEHGIPLPFLIESTNTEKIDGSYWASACPKHNQGDGPKIEKGTVFIKNLNEIKEIKFSPIFILQGSEELVFNLPYEHQPLLIKNNDIIFTVEFDDQYFQIAIDKTGVMKFINLDEKSLNLALDYIQSTECPKSNFQTDQWYTLQSCKKIWNADKSDVQTIRLHLSCP